MANADRIWPTISCGCGSIETVMGASSGPVERIRPSRDVTVSWSCRGLPQNELPHGFGEALVLVAVGHCARLRLHLVAGVAHGDGKAAFAEHEDVVRHVADGGNLLGGDVQRFGQGCYSR